MKTISILIPAYNEADSLEALYQRICAVAVHYQKRYQLELLFVNDGSTDRTLEILEDFARQDDRVKVVDLSRNFGKEIAMMAGFDHVSGDALVIMDADLQHPPETIEEMLSWWEQGYDDVYAKRRTRADSFWRCAISRFYYWMLQKFSTVPIQRDTGDFRLLDRKCVDALRQFRESQRYTKGMFSWIGFRKKEILFDSAERLRGESKWNTRQLLHLALEGVLSFTVAPLRLASWLGFTISLVSFLYMLYNIVDAIFFGDPVAGYPTLICVVLFLGGVQLLCLGIIGEYLGRIFLESKHRPVYLVRSVISGKDLQK